MEKQLAEAKDTAINLVDKLTEAHSKATEDNQMAEILLFDLIKQSVKIRDRLKLMELGL
jgi:hypothetical protein